MNVDEIIRQLREDRNRLDAAISALEVGASASGGVKRRGRPPGSGNKSTGAPRKRRAMSAAARKRIADATKRRWAAAKKSGKRRL